MPERTGSSSVLRMIQRCCCGATAIEYAMIAALVAAGVLGVVTLMGGNLGSSLNTVGNQFPATP